MFDLELLQFWSALLVAFFLVSLACGILSGQPCLWHSFWSALIFYRPEDSTVLVSLACGILSGIASSTDGIGREMAEIEVFLEEAAELVDESQPKNPTHYRYPANITLLRGNHESRQLSQSATISLLQKQTAPASKMVQRPP